MDTVDTVDTVDTMRRRSGGLIGLILVAFTLIAAACGPGIHTQGPIKRQSHWNVSERSDGGIAVTLVRRDREIQRVVGRDPARFANVDDAVRQARDTYAPASTIDDPLSRDVELDEDSVVTLRGPCDGEDEAVLMIDAALHVPGVTKVISYLSWPGHRPSDGLP